MLQDDVLIVSCVPPNRFMIKRFDDDFVILYPRTGQQMLESNSLTSIVRGSTSWMAYPYFKVTQNIYLSNLLSSLYVLIKKVNMEENKIDLIKNVLRGYLEIYDFDEMHIARAEEAVGCLLGMNGKFDDVMRAAISVTFIELIMRMRRDCGLVVENPEKMLMWSNVLCSLLFFGSEKTEKINWIHAEKDMRKSGIFNIYSPLVLSRGIAPLLTINEKKNIVVYTGKGKDVSLPIILYDPLTDSEDYVDAADLGKKVAHLTESMMVDDREYEEAIMVCIDTSGSMDGCSDFSEDVLEKKKKIDSAKEKYMEIWNLAAKNEIDDKDHRLLKNAVIWFLTHPNFIDWKKRDDPLMDIVLIEQKYNRSIAEMMSIYCYVFRRLLLGNTIKIGNEKYSENKTITKNVEVQYNDPSSEFICPTEFICPISQELMNDPVITSDGFSFDRENIQKWIDEHPRKPTNPLTRNKINSVLIPNRTLKNMITDWKEKNIKKDNSEKKVIRMIGSNPWNEIEYPYSGEGLDLELNVWDLYYYVSAKTRMNRADFYFRGKYQVFGGDMLIVDVLRLLNGESLQLVVEENKMIELEIILGYDEGCAKIKRSICENYSVLNLIYCCPGNYDELQIWMDLKHSGDNNYRGDCAVDKTPIKSIAKKKLHLISGRPGYFVEKNIKYLTRLDVVKKLFDSFVDRSIAGSDNTAIGLVSFNNASKVICSISPYFETFRENMDMLESEGGTALYRGLNSAITELVEWKKKDQEKRGNAKLRIICLSDGHDTESPDDKEVLRKYCLENGVILDCVVIGSDYDSYLGTISRQTGGYMFNPTSIKHAIDIMELETMISSKNRAKNVRYTSNNIIPENVIPPINMPINKMMNRSTNISDQKIRGIVGTIDGNGVKIIKKQLIEMIRNPHPDIDVFVNNDDITFWKIIISGPDGTPYKDGAWLLWIQFPQNYPSSAPNIRFVTPIKHCNINVYGKVCHSILDRNYTPNTKISLIIQCIYGLLLNPDVTDPLDTNLALKYYEANGEYEADIVGHVKMYANKSREELKKEMSR